MDEITTPDVSDVVVDDQETSVDDSEQEATKTPVDPSESKPKEDPKPDPLRAVKHKIKSNGKELELDYDELVRKAQLADGSYERLAESAKYKKEADEIRAKINSGKMEDLLDLIPLDHLLEISSQIQKTQLELQGLSQDEIDLMLYRQEAESAKAKLQQIEDEKVNSERETQSMRAFQIIEQEIVGVMEEAKAQGVPLADLPDIGIEVVDELLAVLTMVEEEEKAGRRYTGKVPTAKDAFEKIQSRYQSRLDTYLQKHSPDKLLSMLTPEQKKALRQASLDDLYGDTPRPGVQQRNELQAPASQSSKPMSMNDYFKQKEQIYGARR